MGLDIYAGSLTRYFAGQWQTTAARAAATMGIEGKTVFSGGVSPWLAAEKSEVAVSEFLSGLSARWGERFEYFNKPLSWNERIDTPYDTEKPDYDGINSLVFVAAYLHRPELVRPLNLDNYDTDIAYHEAGPKGYYMGPMAVFEAHLFLPGDDNFVVVAKDPLGGDRFITSNGVLREMLALVNAQTWKSTPKEWAEWHQRGLIGFGPTQNILVKNPAGAYVVEQESTAHVKDKLEHNAQYAFSCFVRMSDFALQNNVPIVIDR